MQISLTPEDLRPVVAAVVSEALAQMTADSEKLGDQLAYTEPHAARLLGLNHHQLRDERLRGRIGHSKVVGNGIRYSRSDLLTYLGRNRTEVSA
jgi:hypothetical protein